VRFAVDVTTRDLVEARAAHDGATVALRSVGFRHADTGDLGDLVDPGGHHGRARAEIQAERIADRAPTLLHRGCGETRRTDHVSGGENVRYGRPTRSVDLDEPAIAQVQAGRGQ